MERFWQDLRFGVRTLLETPCLYRKPHPALKHLQLERSSLILLDRPAHLFSMVCFTFMVFVSALFWLIRSLVAPRTALAAENIALRQQLAVLNRKIHRPQPRRRDRFFWVILSQLWKNWRQVLIIVKPETVVKWHRQGFKLYWRWNMTRTRFFAAIDYLQYRGKKSKTLGVYFSIFIDTKNTIKKFKLLQLKEKGR